MYRGWGWGANVPVWNKHWRQTSTCKISTVGEEVQTSAPEISSWGGGNCPGCIFNGGQKSVSTFSHWGPNVLGVWWGANVLESIQWTLKRYFRFLNDQICMHSHTEDNVQPKLTKIFFFNFRSRYPNLLSVIATQHNKSKRGVRLGQKDTKLSMNRQ